MSFEGTTRGGRSRCNTWGGEGSLCHDKIGAGMAEGMGYLKCFLVLTCFNMHRRLSPLSASGTVLPRAQSSAIWTLHPTTFSRISHTASAMMCLPHSKPSFGHSRAPNGTAISHFVVLYSIKLLLANMLLLCCASCNDLYVPIVTGKKHHAGTRSGRSLLAHDGQFHQTSPALLPHWWLDQKTAKLPI